LLVLGGNLRLIKSIQATKTPPTQNYLFKVDMFYNNITLKNLNKKTYVIKPN